MRDLHFCGEDLFILAGPTMVLDGDIRLVRWPGARRVLARQPRASALRTLHWASSVELPHARGSDRAEAILRNCRPAWCTKQGWLVLYDAPSEERREGEESSIR